MLWIRRSQSVSLPLFLSTRSATRPRQDDCHTYKTKLKLDKEVGGGDLSELCTITHLIAYPYA